MFPTVSRPDTVTDLIARRIFELSNQVRQKQSAPPLAWDQILAKAGLIHGQDMYQRDFFDHDSPVVGRANVAERVKFVGGQPNNCGENIYWGSGYPPDQLPGLAVNDWMNSEIHRRNLLDPNFRLMGVGVFRDKSDFWVTQVFSQ